MKASSLQARAVIGSILVVAACCVPAAPASAVIGNTQITSPAGPHYSIYAFELPGLSVSGAAPGASDGDLVDLRCYHSNDAASILVAEDVSVTGEAFNVVAGTLSISERLCTLRAVPANTTPGAGSLGPYAGPVLATGSRFTTTVSSGPNLGSISDFEIWAQQLVGAGFYQSAGACGLSDTSLTDATQTVTSNTFECANFFYRDEDPVGTGTRSQIRVDGNNAYASSTAADINNQGAGLPPVSYSYSLDPTTGNLTITESEEIVKCADSAFPATTSSCATFLGTGVRLERKIVQASDGRLITITDQWSSIDGQAHNLDLLNQNDQAFGSTSQVAYRFPGEVGFALHSAGQVVNFPDNTAPAAIYLQRTTTPPDPDPNGKGAIVFDRPSSPATFNFGGGQFYLHHAATVPADSCATIRMAYVQAYTDAEVQSLSNTALTSFGSPPGACPPAPPRPTPTPTNPSSNLSSPSSGPTGLRAAALKKCKKKSGKARKKCKKKALKLPV